MHPCVSVAAHGVASGDSAGEGGGVSHHNPCESCCNFHLWWNCSGGMSDKIFITVDKGGIMCDGVALQ